MIFLSKEGFSKVFYALKEEYDLFGPAIKPGQGMYSDTDICVYERIDSFEQLCFKNRTYFSAREIVSAISEKLFDITKNYFFEPEVTSRKSIIFARSCDIAGFIRLDRKYLENGPIDPYYKKLRGTLSFFLLECLEEFEGCFCQSVGSDQVKEYAASIAQIDDIFIMKIIDKNFNKWFDTQDCRIDLDADEKIEVYKQKRAQQTKIGIPDFKNKQLLENSIWDDYAKRCIGCGRCNVVCPTCSCFSMHDTADENGNYIRKRIWSGCQIDGFSKVATGHEYRTDKGQRLRYKLMHKFHHFKERFGQYMCVGCGRCIEACPEYIDIRVTLDKLNNG